jgi:cytochrome c peroxidase
MAELAAALAPKTDWRFLTAENPETLEPVVTEFDQSVVRLVTADGEQTRILRHVLKVFLVDHGAAVRNIYSAGFLDWRLVLNDILTLVSEND